MVNYAAERMLISFFMGCITCEIYSILKTHDRARRVVSIVSLFLIVSITVLDIAVHDLRWIGAALVVFPILVYPSLIFITLNVRPINRFLALKPFRFLGEISFAICLWHLPVLSAMELCAYLVIGRRGAGNFPVFYWMWVAATLVVSTISTFLLEKPIQRYIRAKMKGTAGPVKKRTKIAAASVCIAVVVIFLAVLIPQIPKSIAFDDGEYTVTRETSPYDDTYEYITYYYNRFMLNEEWREANGIELTREATENIGGKDCQVIALRLTERVPGLSEYYVYVIVPVADKTFYRFMFKSDTPSDEWRNVIRSYNYSQIPVAESVEPEPIPDPDWSDETAEFYESLMNKGDASVTWGLYEPGDYSEFKKSERETGFSFPIVLQYMHLNSDFPYDYLNSLYAEGKICEFTLQITTSNNLDLFGESPMLALLRGDETAVNAVREIARGIKSIEKPVLFRLNNEMNTDWCSYSGIVNLSDPAVYKLVWRLIYDIFKEEGVDNAIWVWNPNNRNYPPAEWNNYINYYPGNGYVHVLGVTGYNTGTYYAEKWAEEWREFSDIYNEIEDKYTAQFNDFPWMITEFACSGIGGDKAKWIDWMFEDINKYENIRIAVWFNGSDYDPEKDNVISRPYRFDETERTLKAFKRGLAAVSG